MVKKVARFVLTSLKASTYDLAGGKVPIRSHLIEANGSSEAWYVPPRSRSLRQTLGRSASWRWGWAGEKDDFLNILPIVIN